MKIESQIEQAGRRFGPAAGSITTTIALFFCGTAALTAHERDDHRAPEVPPQLLVHDGNKVHAHGFGVGFQIYTWNGTNWGSAVPEATLFDEDGDFMASHFAGPTWESKDGSKVVGALHSHPWLDRALTNQRFTRTYSRLIAIGDLYAGLNQANKAKTNRRPDDIHL